MRNLFFLPIALAVLAVHDPTFLAAQSHVTFGEIGSLRLSGRVPAEVDSLVAIEEFLTPAYLESLERPPCGLGGRPSSMRHLRIGLPEQESPMEIDVVWHDPHPEPGPQLFKLRRPLEDGARIDVSLLLGELAFVVFESEGQESSSRSVLVLAPSAGLADRLRSLARQVLQIECP